MKKIYKQTLLALVVVGAVITMAVLFGSRGGRRTGIPTIPYNRDTSGIVIGGGSGSAPKVVRCTTKDCVLSSTTGKGTNPGPTGPSNIEVSYKTPVDVPAGTVITLEMQISPAPMDKLSGGQVK